MQNQNTFSVDSYIFTASEGEVYHEQTVNIFIDGWDIEGIYGFASSNVATNIYTCFINNVHYLNIGFSNVNGAPLTHKNTITVYIKYRKK